MYTLGAWTKKKKNDSLKETFIMDVRPTAMFHHSIVQKWQWIFPYGSSGKFPHNPVFFFGSKGVFEYCSFCWNWKIIAESTIDKGKN